MSMHAYGIKVEGLLYGEALSFEREVTRPESADVDAITCDVPAPEMVFIDTIEIEGRVIHASVDAFTFSTHAVARDAHEKLTHEGFAPLLEGIRLEPDWKLTVKGRYSGRIPRGQCEGTPFEFFVSLFKAQK